MMDLGIANSTGEVEASGGDKKKDTKKDDKKKDKKGAAGEVAAKVWEVSSVFTEPP